MGISARLHEALGRTPAQASDDIAAVPEPTADNKHDEEAGEFPDEKAAEDLPSENVQHGVKLAEALTLTWGKKSLVAIFIW